MLATEKELVEYDKIFNRLPKSLRMNFVCELVQKGALELNMDIGAEHLFLARINLGKDSLIGMHALLVIRNRGVEEVGSQLDDVSMIKEFCEIFGEAAVKYLKPEMRSAHKKLKIEDDLCP